MVDEIEAVVSRVEALSPEGRHACLVGWQTNMLDQASTIDSLREQISAYIQAHKEDAETIAKLRAEVETLTQTAFSPKELAERRQMIENMGGGSI